MTCLMNVYNQMNIRNGKLFQQRLNPGKLIEFQDDFYHYLELVQFNTALIHEDVIVREEFGILRSLRRGVTAHARNMDVPRELVEAMNCWRTEKNAKSGGSNLAMIDHYTDLEAILPTVLRYSEGL